MSFPAWSKCFPSCGFLTWKSRPASPEPQSRERRQLDAHDRRAGCRDDSAAHGTADHGTRTRADRIRPTPSDQFPLVERRQTEPTGRPRGERDPDPAEMERRRHLTTPGGRLRPASPPSPGRAGQNVPQIRQTLSAESPVRVAAHVDDSPNVDYTRHNVIHR